MWEKIKRVTETRSMHKKNDMNDITDGQYYKHLCSPGGFLHYNRNLTVTFNTDGAALFKSSREEIWPMYLVINEIHPSERFLNKNVILWGVWQGRGKPPTMSFLQRFVDEMKEISTSGIIYKKYKNILIFKAYNAPKLTKFGKKNFGAIMKK